MNSSSNNCNQNNKKMIKPCPTIIACTGPSAGVTVPTALTAADTPVTVAALNLNNSCLDNPCTALDFSSNIVGTSDAAADDTFTLQVYKIDLCNVNAPAIPVGSQWVFRNNAAAAFAITFSFSACDCNNCMCNCNCNCESNTCYQYVVRIISSTVTTAGAITINNPTLKAISTCGNICCNR